MEKKIYTGHPQFKKQIHTPLGASNPGDNSQYTTMFRILHTAAVMFAGGLVGDAFFVLLQHIYMQENTRETGQSAAA